jgi:hypothetical protein
MRNVEPVPIERFASVEDEVSDEDTPLSLPITKRQRLKSRSTERIFKYEITLVGLYFLLLLTLEHQPHTTGL